jgi:N-dimethylarginine dimethylaminohydrolase
MRGFGLRTEYDKLNAVMLYVPGPEIGNHPDPQSILHLAPIDYPALAHEFEDIIRTYEALGISSILIDPDPLSEDRQYLYNMMYCRDLLFMTPEGTILSNMANSTRSAEVLYAARTLERQGIPVLRTVSGGGRFEGADAIWLGIKLVMIGIGSRTNLEAFEQIKGVLGKMDVDCIAVPYRATRTQHLLGAVQIVDRDLALVRHELVDREVLRVLEDQHFRIVTVPENEEVQSRQAMNIVTTAPRTILMMKGCPETRELFQLHGLTVAAELELTQVMNGAGGLACATGIISRGCDSGK